MTALLIVLALVAALFGLPLFLVLSFVALSVVSLLGIALKQNKLALERTVATGLASGRMSQLMTMPYRPLADFVEYRIRGEVAQDGPVLEVEEQGQQQQGNEVEEDQAQQGVAQQAAVQGVRGGGGCGGLVHHSHQHAFW